jgi:hypothetical protein
MGLFFKTLGGTGIIIALCLSFFTFVMVNVAITTSWTEVVLTGCSVTNGTHADVTLYTQPRMGMCRIEDAINVKDSQCYMWTDNNFWESYDDVTSSNNGATFAAEHTFPDIYDLMAAVVVFTLVMWIILALHYFKPEWIGRWIAQLIIGLFSALTFVITLYASIASNTTDITDSEKWQLFYRNSLGISCSGNGHTAYTGTGTCVVGFLSSFFTFMLVYFPTLGGRCGMCADLEAIPTDSDINKGLVDGDRKSTDSAYVPPIV